MPSRRSVQRAAAAACVTLLASTVAAQSTNYTCYDGIFGIVARGSDETQGESVQETIMTAIIDAVGNSGSDEVVYPATDSFWDSADIGIDNAQQQMQDYYTSCPTGKMVLMGYSQGAYVIQGALAGANFSGQYWSAISDEIAVNGPSQLSKNFKFTTLLTSSQLPPSFSMVTQAECLAKGPWPRVQTASPPAQPILYVLPTHLVICIPLTLQPLEYTGARAASMNVFSSRTQQWCEDEDPICCSGGDNSDAHLSYWSTNTTDETVEYVQNALANFNGTQVSVANAASTSSSSSSGAASSSSAVGSSLASLLTATSLSAAYTSASASAAAATPNSSVLANVTPTSSSSTSQNTDPAGPSSSAITSSVSNGADASVSSMSPVLLTTVVGMMAFMWGVQVL